MINEFSTRIQKYQNEKPLVFLCSNIEFEKKNQDSIIFTIAIKQNKTKNITWELGK